MKRWYYIAAFLLTVGLAAAGAQGPFSAQIQAAFITVGLWPYAGAYSDGQCPAWSVASNKFVGGACAASATVPASSVTAGTFAAGNFAFPGTLSIASIVTAGTDGVDTAINVPPANGFKWVREDVNRTTLVTGADAKFRFNLTTSVGSIQPLGAVEDVLDLSATVPYLRITDSATSSVVKFKAIDNNNLMLGQRGSSGSDPVAQILNSANANGDKTDSPGANFTIASGKGNGAGAASSLIFQTAVVGASGMTLQSLATRLTLTDGMATVGAGGLRWTTLTRPTCDSSVSGAVWYVAGGAGVADTFAVCAKDGADAYAWRTIY
jgi:hypothetical protein